MFLEAVGKRNKKLIEEGFNLHQSGKVMPDSYIIDVDTFLDNARKILEKAKKYNIKLYYMLKQIGRNPYLAKKLEELGYEGAVVVDFKEAEIMIKNNLKIGNIGHLVQIPRNMIEKVVKYNPGIITVYSVKKAEDISRAAEKNNKIQDIMLKVTDEDSDIYPGQESGFEVGDIKKNIDKILKFKGVRINGLTSFPCFLYDEDKKIISPTENLKSIFKVKEILKRDFRINVEQINLPSVTSTENIEELYRLGGTHGEPGHSLTGTIPMGINKNTEEIPAYIYVSEVSHNFRNKGYFFGGGYYRRGNLKNALVGKSLKESFKTCVNEIDAHNIDYYLELENEGTIGDTVITCFRTQMFVTRSNVVLVGGIRKDKAEIIGNYTTLGEKVD